MDLHPIMSKLKITLTANQASHSLNSSKGVLTISLACGCIRIYRYNCSMSFWETERTGGLDYKAEMQKSCEKRQQCNFWNAPWTLTLLDAVATSMISDSVVKFWEEQYDSANEVESRSAELANRLADIEMSRLENLTPQEREASIQRLEQVATTL